MICPACGAAELVRDTRDTRDMPVEHNGQTTTIPAVTGDYCPACGEAVLDREQGDRVGELVGAFVRQVDGPVKRYRLEDLEVFDVAEQLDNEESIRAFLADAREEADPRWLPIALAHVARARKRWGLPAKLLPGVEK